MSPGIKAIVFFIAACFTVSGLAAQSEPCGMEMMQQQYVKQNPSLNNKIATKDQEAAAGRPSSGVVYVIPVVFHILHDNGIENISDAQICDAVKLLNEDFRKKNSDTVNTLSTFKAIAGDAEIEFRLATIDPNGNATTGIDRIHTALTHNADDNSKLNQWPPSRYLNIWSVDSLAMINGISGVKGYAYGPAFASVYPQYDGILIRHDCLGRFGSGDMYQAVWARILTHEAGHYFNLLHIWGNSFGVGTSCSGDDLVADTPPTKGSLWCADLNLSTCGYPDNVQNYMNYSYCYTMFTQGQVTRMRTALNSATAGRTNLWTAANLALTGTTWPGACLPTSVPESSSRNSPLIYPNPAQGIFQIQYPEGTVDITIDIINLMGQIILTLHHGKEIDLSAYPKGMYVIKIYSGTATHTEKIFVY